MSDGKRKRNWAEALHQEGVKVRNRIASAMLQPGGGGENPSTPQTKEFFHTEGNRRLTKALGSVLSPRAAATAADALYGLNETATGSLAKLSGLLNREKTPFFSKYGYNVDDLRLNREGQQQAIRELEAEQESEPLDLENKAAVVRSLARAQEKTGWLKEAERLREANIASAKKKAR